MAPNTGGVVVAGAVLGLVASCSYSASFRDCTIACSPTSGCPSGFGCEAGVCRAAGAVASCNAVRDAAPGEDGRGSHTDDSRSLDANLACPGSDMLAGYAPSQITASATFCTNPPDGNQQSAFLNHWYREFEPSDDSCIAGPYRISAVHFACFSSRSTSTSMPSPMVTIWQYSGDVGSGKLTRSALTLLASDSLDAESCADDDQVLAFEPAVEVATGSPFVIEVDGADTFAGVGGPLETSFHLGVETNAVPRRSYLAVNCQTTLDPAPAGSDDYLISVDGNY